MAKSKRITCKRKRKESKKVRKPLRKQGLQPYRCFSFSSRYCMRFGDREGPRGAFVQPVSGENWPGCGYFTTESAARQVRSRDKQKAGTKNPCLGVWYGSCGGKPDAGVYPSTSSKNSHGAARLSFCFAVCISGKGPPAHPAFSSFLHARWVGPEFRSLCQSRPPSRKTGG